MADAPVVHIGENSPEQVAWKLFQTIAHAEGKRLVGAGPNADREYILTTYARCLHTVQQPGWVYDALKENFGKG